jgi:hypothetical protein
VHPSARSAAISFFDEYVENKSAQVLEVGSASVNDSLREYLPRTLHWLGVDLEEGPGVDLVLSDPYELPFPAKTFDVSMATSVFEHNEMFWLTFLELVRVVSDGGLVYLCSPSNGHIHRYPVDCYRFYPDAGFALQNWARRSQYEVTLIESVVLRKDESEWNDWVAVFRVGPYADQPTSPPRLTQKLKPFSIGQGTPDFQFTQAEATEDQIELHNARQALEALKSSRTTSD